MLNTVQSLRSSVHRQQERDRAMRHDLMLARGPCFHDSRSMTRAHAFKVLPAMLLLASCDDKPAPTTGNAAPATTAPASPAPAPVAAASPTPAPAAPTVEYRKIFWTDELLHSEIKHYNSAYEGGAQFSIENGVPVAIDLHDQKVDNLRGFAGIPIMAIDLSGTNVGDLSPLKGLPIREIMLERTRVTDLTPLRGAPIEKIYLSSTPISKLDGLEGAPITDLNLVGTQVSDLSALANCPNLHMLWLTGCPVENIAPLRTVPLVSLTLHRTKVKDLSPLSGTALQRLHIGETPVSDLTPLKGLSLTRLVFTPANIKAGLDVARALPLQEIGTRFDDEGKDLQPPEVFWSSQPAAPAAK